MKAIVYVRCSTQSQADSGAGLNAQLDACKKYAISKGLEIRAIFQDVASGSAHMEKRQGIVSAICACKLGDVVICLRRDRIGRDPFNVCVIERKIQENGGRLETVDGNNGSEPSDKFSRAILDCVAAFERDMIKERTRAAMSAKKARHERVGTIPYGERLIAGGKLELDPKEQIVLKKIHALREAGMTLRSIAEELTALGHHSKKGKLEWSTSSVASILKRTTRTSDAVAFSEN